MLEVCMERRLGEGVWRRNGKLKSQGRSITLQGINISHLGKRKIIFKMAFLGDMLVPWRVRLQEIPTNSW